MTDIDTRAALNASSAAAVIDRLKAGAGATPQQRTLSPEALAVTDKFLERPVSPIVLAGLLRTEKVRTASKLPFLGDVPLLGYLFGAASYDERQSELVFVVTPSLVNTKAPLKPEADYGKGRPGVFPKP